MTYLHILLQCKIYPIQFTSLHKNFFCIFICHRIIYFNVDYHQITIYVICFYDCKTRICIIS